ncbi:MAG: CAP domain-containing protein, partial [Waterburya sp.]
GTSDQQTGDTDSFDQEILGLVNEQRAKVGADPLQIDEQLDQAADLHSLEQASMDNMTYYGSNGSEIGDRVWDTGYQYSTIAENIAADYPDAEAVMASWMGSSEGHRENILNGDFEDLGVGYSIGDDGSAYWTQVFGADMA